MAKWSNKDERQYKHIKKSVKQRGKSEDTAEEIAAITEDEVSITFEAVGVIIED